DGNTNTSGVAPTDANLYEQGLSVTVLAQGSLVKTGYTFGGWNTAADGSGTNQAAGSSFNMGTANVTLYAQWTANPTYTLTTAVDPASSGTVTGAGSYDAGVTANITATPIGDYEFVNWTGASVGAANSATTTILMDGDKTVTANFALKKYTLTLLVNPAESGTVTGAGTYSSGATVTIIATVKNCYEFVNWTGDTVADANSANTTIVMNSNKSVTVNFKLTDNAAPVITSTPDTTAVVGTEYTYKIEATDTDCWPNITYSLEDGPAGMSITGDTISWTPVCADIKGNPHSVTVRATDDGSPALYAEKTFDITVSSTNKAPVITPISDGTAVVVTPYTYQIVATDTDCWPNITYSLEDGPAGMSITGDTISWTPDCADIGANSVTVRATDNGSPALYAEDTFVITVSSTNKAPVITSSPGTSAVVGTPYTYKIEATDTDCWDTITYSLVSGPTGMTFDGTDTIKWNPTCAQIGDHAVKVKAADNGTPVLYDEQTFTITVSSVNSAPVITPIPDGTAVVGTPYTYTITATDTDCWPNITYSKVAGPAGLTVGSTTGLISWTPDCADIGVNSVTVRATDNGSPALYAEDTFVITVSSVNSAPVITPIPDGTAVVGTPYTYTITATDTDCWPNITYFLEDGPTGMSITGDTISWTPVHAGNNSVTVRATDNGSPALYAEKTFKIKVSK
ncbi:MAG: putative Ig domain-containing protein, partial [Candidatus Atribacteria bacterium]|nr:putative Ig domain-containing protein [Candidatus Atribacteria bacterium]